MTCNSQQLTMNMKDNHIKTCTVVLPVAKDKILSIMTTQCNYFLSYLSVSFMLSIIGGPQVSSESVMYLFIYVFKKALTVAFLILIV